MRLDHFQRALVFAQAVRQRAVELQPVAVGPHAAVAKQVAGVLVAEQILTRGHRPGIKITKGGLQCVVERVTGFFVPEERIGAQHFCVGDRGLQIKPAIRIDRQTANAAQFSQHRLDTRAVFIDGGAADFHLHHGVAAVEVAAHFAAQGRHVFAGVVVAAGRIDKHLGVRYQTVPFGQ